MRDLNEILAISADRKGGEAPIFADLEPSLSPEEIAQVPDDRWLAEMTRSVFQAGFNWKVVERMWPGFEEAFHGFDVDRCAFMNEDWFDELCRNTAIVRYPQKIRAVQQNAIFIKEQTAAHGGFGKMVAAWPGDDFAGLLALLKKDGSRLGGTTGQYFLRLMGVDGYLLSRDVTARLIAEGVIDKPPTSRSAMMAVQAAMNTWAEQSGRSLKEVSLILATSCG
ncbi:3-methyladenine DNA glycosylase [Tateyamaria omphalii]|uniref:DNA-3-methyladenine glycosylase I n=1 Tax=Tateyamaria omphalii TaxID=299262 RepID=UPI0016762F87|nr:DNA-3-methyladenine glycosylase I [Tateyamaria omphalii]GGX65640.1 3-methyladenine DNA glycosylase [Tateyamaria omphalii]